MSFEYSTLFITSLIIFTIAALFDLWRVGWFYWQEQKSLDNLVEVLRKKQTNNISTKITHLTQQGKKNSNSLVDKQIKFVLQLYETKKLGYIRDIRQLATNKKLKKVIINEIILFTQSQDYLAQFIIVVLFLISIVNAILSTVGYELISNLIAINQEDNIQIINNLKNLSIIISLIGAICTGFLLFVRLAFVQPLKKHFIVHLDWVTMFYLVPIFEQSEQQIQERKQLRAFHQKFSQNFEGSLKSSLDDLQQQLIKYNDELAKQHNLPEMQNTFKEFTKDFDDFAMVLKQTKEFIDQLNNTDNYSKTNKLIADMDQHLHEQDVQFRSRFHIIFFLLSLLFLLSIFYC